MLHYFNHHMFVDWIIFQIIIIPTIFIFFSDKEKNTSSKSKHFYHYNMPSSDGKIIGMIIAYAIDIAYSFIVLLTYMAPLPPVTGYNSVYEYFYKTIFENIQWLFN